MKYNPDIHHRRSIRLKGYDYAQAGLYFVTICVQHRKCLFGTINDDVMVLNDAGRMVEKWYAALENKFPDIQCQAHVVMPNHFHAIIENTGSNITRDVRGDVGADLRVGPDGGDKYAPGEHTGGEHTGGEHTRGEHVGSPLHRVVQWFKTMTTNEYIRNVKNNGWERFDGKLWQRNYYEHIIRNERAYQQISQYIIDNPNRWQNDKLHPSTP